MTPDLNNMLTGVRIIAVILGCVVLAPRAFAATTSTNTGTVNVTATVSGAAGGGAGAPAPTPAPPPPSSFAIQNIRTTDITATSSIVRWDTTQSGSSKVEYGRTVTYGNSVADTQLVTAHATTLPNLLSGTLYHFRVRSTNSSNTEVISDDQTFTTAAADTTPPTISAIVSTPAATSATITFTTSEKATSTVQYGTAMGVYDTSITAPRADVSHSFTLAGLTEGVTYYFIVTATDEAGNRASAAEQQFTTTDQTPPVISNIVSTPAATSATVAWDTSEPADSLIEYHLQVDATKKSASDATLTRTHSLEISPLIPNRTYSFTVWSRDAAGNTASEAKTFTTPKDDRPPPNVGDFAATLRYLNNPDGTQGAPYVALTWVNPTVDDLFGVTIRRSTSGYPTGQFTETHIYTSESLTKLGKYAEDLRVEEDVTYYYTIFSYDTSRNYASGATAMVAVPRKGEVPASPPKPEEPSPEPETARPETPAEAEPSGVTPTEAPDGAAGAPAGGAGEPSAEGFLTLNDTLFFAADRTVPLTVRNGLVEILARTSLGVTIRKEKLPAAPTLLRMTLKDSGYLFALRNDGSAYDVDMITPGTGTYALTIEVGLTDGRTARLTYSLRVTGLGKVKATTLKGETLPLEGAEVTLLDAGGNPVSLTPFGQQNPQTTSEGGVYAFLVPSGTYRLSVKKSNFAEHTTNPLTVEGNVVGLDLSLLELPPPLAEVIKPDAPLGENIVAVAQNLSDKAVVATKIAVREVQKIADNPVVERAAEKQVAPVTVAVAAANAAAVARIPSLLTYLQYVFTQPAYMLFRRRRKEWGVVYNAITKKPVDLALVRLVEAAGGILMQTRVTDKAGRYAFFAKPGSYRIEVSKNGFTFPSTALKEVKEDGKFLDLYHGEALAVDEAHAQITHNIPLDPVGETADVARTLIARILVRKGQHAVALAGIGLSVISFAIAPRLSVGLMTVGHVALYLFFRKAAVPGRPKGWGTVTDATARQPLKYVVARIFDVQYNKLLETQLTDTKGRYGFLVGPNVYYIGFEKKGYAPKKTDPIDMSAKKEGAVVGVDVELVPAAQGVLSQESGQTPPATALDDETSLVPSPSRGRRRAELAQVPEREGVRDPMGDLKTNISPILQTPAAPPTPQGDIEPPLLPSPENCAVPLSAGESQSSASPSGPPLTPEHVEP